MRLSEFEIESIKSLAKLHFGRNVQVFLFGSRTRNQLRGGDIDLFIRNENGEPLKIRTKIDFITDLILQIGEQKIDVVLEIQVAKDSGFLKTIYQTSIQLC
jgi:predicted nucleotidyltransferase